MKPVVAHRLLALGFSVLISDPDICWLSGNVLNYRQAQARWLVFSSEAVPTDTTDFYVNTGLYFARPTPEVIAFFKLVHARQIKKPDIVDQYVVNSMLHAIDGAYSIASHPQLEALLSSQWKALSKIGRKWIVADQWLFANGHDYFLRSAGLRGSGLQQMTIHMNYMVGRDAKVGKLKSICWHIPSAQHDGADQNKDITL